MSSNYSSKHTPKSKPSAEKIIGRLPCKSNDSEASAAHTVLGAAVAIAGGNDVLLAGVSAGGAEASAPLLAKCPYDKESKNLTADEKGTVSAITGLVASGVGASTGDVASSVQSGQLAQNAVENNGLENVLLPHEIDEIKNDHKGDIPKQTLQAIKNNTSYKINQNGDFIVCVKVAGYSCAPRVGERYATSEEIAQKGGESLITMAAGYGAGKVVEPIVLSISKSGIWSKLTSIFKNSENIPVNPNTGLKEVNPSNTPLSSHEKLNQLDQGKLKPAEAATGAQLESVLGPMEKYSGSTASKNPDWVVQSGPFKGKTVDAMYTTDKLSQKEIEGLNKFYEKNMTVAKKVGELPPEIQNIQKHLLKADFVPVDFRVLNEKNKSIFLNYVKTLPKSQQNKFIIVR